MSAIARLGAAVVVTAALMLGAAMVAVFQTPGPAIVDFDGPDD